MYLPSPCSNYKPYSFYWICRTKYHHYDAGNGAMSHYLALMKSGHARIEAEHSTVTIQEGDAFYIPLGCRYQSYWYGENIQWYSFAFPFFPNPEERIYPVQRFDVNSGERDMFEALAADMALRIDCRALIGLYSLLDSVIPHMTVENGTSDDSIVRRAKKIMQSMPDFSIPQLARQCAVSESALYAAFKHSTGVSPIHYRQSMMVDKAKELLAATDLTVRSVSETTGFSSEAYFYQVFHKVTGMTPSEYRKIHTL